jgi:hypothetical protein
MSFLISAGVVALVAATFGGLGFMLGRKDATLEGDIRLADALRQARRVSRALEANRSTSRAVVADAAACLENLEDLHRARAKYFQRPLGVPGEK